MTIKVNVQKLGLKNPITVQTTPKVMREAVRAMKVMAHAQDNVGANDPMVQLDRLDEMLSVPHDAIVDVLGLSKTAANRLDELGMDDYNEFLIGVFSSIVGNTDYDGTPVEPDDELKK